MDILASLYSNGYACMAVLAIVGLPQLFTMLQDLYKWVSLI